MEGVPGVPAEQPRKAVRVQLKPTHDASYMALQRAFAPITQTGAALLTGGRHGASERNKPTGFYFPSFV